MTTIPYCIKCNDSKTKPCKKCVYDPYVMILHTDAKKLFRLTNEDIENSIIYEYNFRAHSQTCSKYFLNEIEEIAIEKYEALTDGRNIRILDKILEMKNKRVQYITKYVTIRSELKNLVDKIHDDDNYSLDESTYQMISTLAATSEDIYTCVNLIYNNCSKVMLATSLAKKRVELVEKLFIEGLGNDWNKLVNTRIYEQLIDINCCKEDNVVDNVNKEINNQQKIKERTKSLNKLLRDKLDISSNKDNFEEYLNHIIKTREYYYLNDIGRCTWVDVQTWINNADNINIFQTIINCIEKERQIENYIKTNVNKTYQKYIINKNIAHTYANNTETLEQIQIMIQNLVNKRKRKLSVKRYVDKIMKIFEVTESLIDTFLIKRNATVQDFIVNGGKMSQIKGTIHNIICRQVKERQIGLYISEKQIYEKPAIIYQNQTIMDFINAECDINQKDLLSDDIKQLINKLRAPLVKKQQLDNYIENRKVYDKRYEIYNNETVKLFLDAECDVNVLDYMYEAIEVKRVIVKVARKKELDEYIKRYTMREKDAIYNDQNIIDFLNNQSVHSRDHLPNNIKIIINNIRVSNKKTPQDAVTVQSYDDDSDFEGNIMIERNRRVNIRKILAKCNQNWIKYNQNAIYADTRVRNFIDNYGKSYCDENWNSIKILIHEYINIPIENNNNKNL